MFTYIYIYMYVCRERERGTNTNALTDLSARAMEYGNCTSGDKRDLFTECPGQDIKLFLMVLGMWIISSLPLLPVPL